MQDSRLIRNVDLYVGRASCGAISLFRKLTKIRTKKTIPVKRVLLIELFEMGAAVMMAPSIRYLKKQNPEIEIHALTTQSCVSIWKALGVLDADKVHCMESGSAFRFLWSAFTMILRLRRIRFDLIIDYELFMRIPAIFSGLLKGRIRGGFYKYDFEGLERGEFYEAKCAYNQNSHIAKNYLALTKTTFEQRHDSPNFKEVIKVEEILVKPTIEKSLHDLGHYIVVCPDVGKTLSVRNYPRESFAKVVQDLLISYPQYKIVIIGTKENRETSQEILAQVPLRERCIDYCGKTDFDGLLKLISGAELLITNDNGPGHFATLTGTKTLALFSTDSPFIYGPLGDAVIAYTFYQCSPCISAYNHKVSRCDNNLCLQTLSAVRVVELAKSILDGKARFQTINNQIPYLL